MQNGSQRFGVYTAQGEYLAHVRSDAKQAAQVELSSDKAMACKLARSAAVRALHFIRGFGVPCWLVSL